MSSSAQLRVGLTLSKAQLKSQWLKLNNDSGHQVHVSQNTKKPKARYFQCALLPLPVNGRRLKGNVMLMSKLLGTMRRIWK